MPTKTQTAQRCDRKKAGARLSQAACEHVQDEMMMNTVPSAADANLETYRPRLFGIAFRMLGDVQDAEDLVQETMLRWQKTERASVRETEAWLVAVITRLAIDRLRQAQTRRAQYPGPWLPEPIAEERLSPEYRSELASDLSMAFLVLLERLAPEERAAFLLRDVFGCDYDEIARAHVLNGYETNPAGEIQQGSFQGGNRREDGFFFIQFVLLQFHQGIKLTPIAKAEVGYFDPVNVLWAIHRGAMCRVDVTHQWNHWPLMPLGLEEARRQIGLLPKIEAWRGAA
jgi:RNA polymerase sigma factor (sigma-70 family)